MGHTCLSTSYLYQCQKLTGDAWDKKAIKNKNKNRDLNKVIKKARVPLESPGLRGHEERLGDRAKDSTEIMELPSIWLIPI